MTKRTRHFKCIPLILFLVLFFGEVKAQSFDPQHITSEWQLVENNFKQKSEFHAAISFVNKSESWPAANWKIYFSLRYHGYNLSSLNPKIVLNHVSGDLFSVEPGKGFKGFVAGEPLMLDFKGKGRVANYQDVPSGLFFVNTKQNNVAVAMPNPAIRKNVALNNLSAGVATKVYIENKRIENLPADKVVKIFPTPESYQEDSGNFELNTSTSVYGDPGFESESNYLVGEIARLTGKRPEVSTSQKSNQQIILKKVTLSPEAYRLLVTSDKVVIEAPDGAGIFHGIQSLKSLLDADVWRETHQSLKIQNVTIADAPRFPFRSFMLDVGRDFQSKEQILRILEVMSLYKLNVFHFHLNDDEGWRIEIPGLPELTEVGSNRGYPFAGNQQLHPSYGSGPDGKKSQGSGFYSKQDYVEILRFATERHIKVIPEIESPGHARAAVKAMDARFEKYHKLGNDAEATKYLLHERLDKSAYMSNQYFNDNVMNAALPSTYTFVEKVIDELKFMYAEAGAPLTLIHMAGDEVPAGTWGNSPAVRAMMEKNPSLKTTQDVWRKYFITINDLLHTKGLSLYGWEELVLGTQTTDHARSVVVHPEFVRDKIQVDAWWNIFGNENVPYQLANTGYKVVLSFFDYLYFDLAYRPSFDEPGDGWVGYLDMEKTWSFIPYDYYRNDKTDLAGNLYPKGYFDKKVALTAEGRNNVVGMQGALWGENLNDPELVEYQLLPKLLSLAERAWAKDPDWAKETDTLKSQKLYTAAWSAFVNTVGKRELPKLDNYNGGYHYRIPSPGVMVSEGKVFANVQLPGYVIRYTEDGTEPTADSKVYSAPLAAKNEFRFKTFDTRGLGSKTISVKP